MIRLVMAGMISLSLLVVATAQQKTQETESRQTDQTELANKLGTQGDKLENGEPAGQRNQRTELPELFRQIDLNEQQKQQLLAIYRDSDQKSQEIWDHVQDLHLQAISMEAAAIAAARLEGHDHDAHEGQAVKQSSTESERTANSTVTDASTDPANRREKTSPAADTKVTVEQRRADTGENADESRKTNSPGKPSDAGNTASVKGHSAISDQSDGDLNVVSIRVGIAQPNGRVCEYLLAPRNSQAVTDSNPALNTHASQLTQVWKDIHDGHENLVEIEADTIVKVEAQLTEAQLLKLDSTESQAANTSRNPNDDSRR